jgi:molybdenum cofactor guanylyltransferase
MHMSESKSQQPRLGVAPDEVTGVVLAGGRGSRMGGTDKGLIELAGRPLIEHVLEALEPQVGSILINANRNPARYARYGHPVVGDAMKGFQGPLAGFAAGMAAARTPWVLTVPCDSPRVPPDLLARLAQALGTQAAQMAVARDGDRLQPVYALLPVTLSVSLDRFLAAGGRKTDKWFAQHRYATADFSDCGEVFANLNTPEDRRGLARAHRG